MVGRPASAAAAVARVVAVRAVRAMRDVEYLFAAAAGAAPPLEGALIYRYRTGVLRPRMRAALCAAAEGQGRRLTDGDFPLTPGFAEPGLFDAVRLYDWPKRVGAGVSTAAFEDSLAALAAQGHRLSFHFVPHDGAVTGYRGWPAAARACCVIEETAITRASLPAVLRYVAATTDLAPGADFLAQPGFIDSFADLIEDGADLAAVIQAFDERALLCVDPETHRFDPALYRRHAVRRAGRRAPLRHLRDLAVLRREADLIDLVCAYDERRWERGWTGHEVVADLYRITARLLDGTDDAAKIRATPRGRVATHVVAAGAYLWAALLLAHEDGLRRGLREERDGYRRAPDLLVPILAGLGRDVRARAGRAEAGDPLADRWTPLARALGQHGVGDPEDRLSRARAGLVQALAGALGRHRDGRPDWLRRLHAETLVAVARVEPCACARERLRAMRPTPMRDDLPPPRTFETVIGRTHAVEALRRHALDRDAGVDLLLHGPAGVGKTMLARLYGRAVLCESPEPTGSPCGACASCRGFDNGLPDYAEPDGACADVAHHTEQIIAMLGASVFARRRVIVIRNADAYPPALFDQLLRPMEDSGRASFVLLTRDPERVRLAGRSRCFDYRVRPLDRPQADACLREMLETMGLSCDEATRSVVLDAGAGLPGHLHRACRAMAAAKPSDVAAARALLGLDWAEGVAAALPAITVGPSTALAGLMRASGADRAEQIRRMRALLQAVYLGSLQGDVGGTDAIDPALRHLDEARAAQLAAILAERAAQDGTTIDAVWQCVFAMWEPD